MRILLGVAAALVFATGLVAYRAAWLCHRHPDRAGWWLDSRAGLILFVFLATMTGPLMIWVQRGALLGWRTVAYRFAVYLVGMMLCIPLVTYHAAGLVGRALSPESEPPPEPEDPFERAKAAEERGDVHGAIERYSALLDEEPTHLEGRIGLAELLARTRRLSGAIEVVRQGLALEDLPPDRKAELTAILRRWEEGRLGEEPSGDPRCGALATRRMTTPRMEAHEAGRRDEPEGEPPIPL